MWITRQFSVDNLWARNGARPNPPRSRYGSTQKRTLSRERILKSFNKFLREKERQIFPSRSDIGITRQGADGTSIDAERNCIRLRALEANLLLRAKNQHFPASEDEFHHRAIIVLVTNPNVGRSLEHDLVFDLARLEMDPRIQRIRLLRLCGRWRRVRNRRFLLRFARFGRRLRCRLGCRLRR